MIIQCRCLIHCARTGETQLKKALLSISSLDHPHLIEIRNPSRTTEFIQVTRRLENHPGSSASFALSFSLPLSFSLREQSIIYIVSCKRDLESARLEKRGIRRRCFQVSAGRIMAAKDNAPARIPQVPPNAERAPFHYLDCIRVQFVSKKSARREGWMDCHRGRIGGRGAARASGGEAGKLGWIRGERRARRKEDRPIGELEGTPSMRRDGETTEKMRRSARARCRMDRPTVDLAHYNFYDWSFGWPGALTRMPTCKGHIIVTTETGLSAEVSVVLEFRDSIPEAN